MWLLVVMSLQGPGPIVALDSFTSREDCVQAIVDSRPLPQSERQRFRLACVVRS